MVPFQCAGLDHMAYEHENGVPREERLFKFKCLAPCIVACNFILGEPARDVSSCEECPTLGMSKIKDVPPPSHLRWSGMINLEYSGDSR